MDVTVIVICLSFNFLLVKSSSDMPQKIVFSPSELETPNFISNSSLKPALRYGFHRTHECRDFAKAYICVQKCVDLRYDLSYSDKHCFCTCYHKKEKAKYTTHSDVIGTKWKLGPPATTKPAWAVKKVTQKTEKAKMLEGEHEEDHAKNVDDISNTTPNAEVNDLSETAGNDTNLIEGNLIENGNATDGLNTTDSEVSNSTAAANPAGAGEAATGVTLNPANAGGEKGEKTTTS